MSRHASITRNVLSNWLSLGTSIVATLILTPVIVRALGEERYGVWSFLNGLVAYSDLLYLGLGASLVRYVAQATAESDLERVNRLASAVLTIYLILGLGCLVALAGLSGSVPLAFANGLPAGTARAAAIACSLLGARLLLAFVASGFSGLLSGHERFDVSNVVGMSASVVRVVGTIAFVASSASPLVAVAIVTCVTAALETTALGVAAFYFVPGLSIRFVRPSVREISLLYRFGTQSFVVLLAFKLISYADTTVIGLTLGAASVALYTVPLQIVEYMRLAIGGFSGVLLPRLTRVSVEESASALSPAYLRTARLTAFLAGWLGALVVALGPSFLARWVGASFGAAAPPILDCLVAAAFAYGIATQISQPFFQTLDLVGRQALVLSIEAVINLALSIWLAPRLGIVGVALATAVPALAVSFAILPWMLCRRFGIRASTFAWSGLGPGVAMFVVTAGVEWLTGQVVTGGSYVSLAIRAICSAPLAIAVVGALFPADERRFLLARVRDAANWTRT